MTRELSVAIAIVVLAAALAFAAPGFFAGDNLRDLFLANVPVLIAAVGITLVILTGHIDISIGSIFAISAVASGLLAKAGLPLPFVLLASCAVGAALGSVNGALTAYLRIPSIVVTLATMIAWREGLRWATQGAWIQDLPPHYQWLGTSDRAYPFMQFGASWVLRNVAAGRAVYATGSSLDAARLAGVRTATVTFVVFAIAGALTGLARCASTRFPATPGLGSS
jgi:rhamnose transport system permease protein